MQLDPMAGAVDALRAADAHRAAAVLRAFLERVSYGGRGESLRAAVHAGVSERTFLRAAAGEADAEREIVDAVVGALFQEVCDAA